MTSINLVSPVDNGHTYSVRFREPLVIEANSKVYLNFAKFKRNSSIYFNTDQTIEVVLNEVLPTVLPAAAGTANTVMGTNSITIPVINPLTNQSGYTASQLEQVINERLGGDPEVAADYGIRAVAGVPKQMMLYNPVYERQDYSKIAIGWYKDYNILDLPSWLGLSGAHNFGMAENGLGDVCVKTSANAGADPADLYYDCFGMSKQTYDFSYQSALSPNSENHNLIEFQANMSVGEQVGSIFMGLSSHEIADSLKAGGDDWTAYADGSSDNSFTHGTTGTQTSSSGRTLLVPILYKPNSSDALQSSASVADKAASVPQAFLGIEITGSSQPDGNKQMLNIWRASNYTTRHNAPTRAAAEINRMIKVWSCPMASLLEGADANNVNARFALQTYWAEGFQASTNDKLEFRLFNLINSNYVDNTNLIYDSKNSIRWLTYNFFRQKGLTTINTGTDAQKAQKANSQIPFNVLMSAQKVGEGFETLKMAGWEKTGTNSPLGTATNNSPITLVQAYQFKISSELARFVGVNESDKYNPNLPENQVSSIVKEDADQHTDESYSIFLKNLPISAYKNIQSKAMSAGNNVQSAGYAQPIIHDVPTPYSDSKVINSGTGDIIVGTFQPSIQKKLDLDNNRQVLNSLDVEIRDIESNVIAEGLSGSVINFTIEKP